MANVLSDYIEHALARIRGEQLSDRSFTASIAEFPGMIVFAETAEACPEKLRRTLEGWILLALKKGILLPEINGINLNREFEAGGKNSRSKLIQKLRELNFHGPFTVNECRYMIYNGRLLSVPSRETLSGAQLRAFLKEVNDIVSEEEWNF